MQSLMLFKLFGIIDINFAIIISFLLGIAFGAIIICLVYAVFVLSSLRSKKFFIKTEDDTLTDTEVKDMIKAAQNAFHDKELRGKDSKPVHCYHLCKDLVYGIASRFYPKSKHPLMMLSIDETLMLLSYVEVRLNELLDRPGLRMIKKISVAYIYDVSTNTSKTLNSKTFKIVKETNSVIDVFKKVLNTINPIWWVRKAIMNTSVALLMNKLCTIVIALVGEETYKIYSKKVFNKDVEIDSGIEDEVSSMTEEIEKAALEIKNAKPTDEIKETNEKVNLKLKNKSMALKNNANDYEISVNDKFETKKKVEGNMQNEKEE